MLRHLLVGCSLAFFHSGFCATAHAGAFNQEAGQAQVIATTTRTISSDFVTGNGSKLLPVRFQKVERALLLEAGLTDQAMLIFRPSLISASLGSAGPTMLFDARGPTDIGGQVQAYRDEENVVSFQALLHLPSPSMHVNTWLVGQTHTEPEMRALYAYSMQVMGAQSFFETQAGFRRRSGGPPNEWHLDLTGGFRIGSDQLLLIQSFLTKSEKSRDPGFPAFTQRKVQVSLVKDFGAFSIQGGWFVTASARNAYNEQGTLLGVWTRF